MHRKLYSSDQSKLNPALERLKAAYHLSQIQPQRPTLIYQL
jgi:hypothetical protein